jgi:hypothetical protein
VTTPPVSPIALTKPAAAAALGISTDSFERHVQPHVAVIRRGRLRLFPVAELERWAHKNAEKPPTITHTYVLDGAEIYRSVAAVSRESASNDAADEPRWKSLLQQAAEKLNERDRYSAEGEDAIRRDNALHDAELLAIEAIEDYRKRSGPGLGAQA